MKTLVLLLLNLVLFTSACKKENTDPSSLREIKLNSKQASVVNSSNAFGFDFFRSAMQFKGDEDNFMISPLSVGMALGMTRNGAANSTLDSMTNALRFNGMSEADINEAYQYIIHSFINLDPKVKLAIANSIWYRNNFNVEDSFITTNKTYFDAEVSPVDFSDPATISIINDWVSENTNNLIPKIIETIPEEMVMYLINAVHFKGEWKYKFETGNTQLKQFTTSSGSTIQAPAMTQRSTFALLSQDNFEILELPYGQSNFNMSVVLPDIGKTIDDIVPLMTQDNWNTWSTAYVNTDVEVQLPKFKFSYDEEKMKEILSSMGMGIAFEPGLADFTRINRDGQLYISEVKHKTFIETNEEGSEAAAVTSVGVALTSVGENGPHYFIVDRPFVFLITEKTTSTILFIGTVNNPLL
ncbi:MAG TPA: serpin family protein [Lentimicrobium sp.]|nr:serpin family protein [Lentimicrobium sp.]